MNSIKRPRRRPRVESINFRTFGWLLVHEAAFRVLCYYGRTDRVDSESRAALAAVPSDTLRRRAQRRMNFQPYRRIAP